MNRSSWAILFVAMIALSGCEAKSVPVSVSGNVTLGGAPLDGTIRFVPASGTPPAAVMSKITAGKYSIPADGGLALGNYRVEISSLQTTDALATSTASPTGAKELVPARYNAKSDLTTKLTRPENTADFELKPM